MLNLATFIVQRRHEGFAERAPAQPAGFYARRDSAQLAAWNAHARATRGRTLPRDRDGGWMVASEWPPGHAGNGVQEGNDATARDSPERGDCE